MCVYIYVYTYIYIYVYMYIYICIYTGAGRLGTGHQLQVVSASVEGPQPQTDPTSVLASSTRASKCFIERERERE